MADVDFTNFPVNLSPDASDYLIGGSGDNSSEFLTTLSGLSGVINPVDSVHGRVGVVVGQTGDYADTGITNTSNVNGGTVKDALETLASNIETTGSLQIDNGGLNLFMSGSSISSGIKGIVNIPYNVSLVDYQIIADSEADLEIDVRTGSYDTWAGESSLISVCPSATPQLNSQVKNTSGDFGTSWNSNTLDSGTYIGLYHNSSTGLSFYNFLLNWVKTSNEEVYFFEEI